MLPFPAQPERCDDGVDQDFDGAVDCEDSDCAAACDERAACDDATDDDRDGLVDCADPDCDGTPECSEVGALCADRRDNDRDGRIDARDAGCWPSARITTTRCAAILGGSLELAPEDFAGGEVELDPLGLGAGAWLSVPPTPGTTAPDSSVIAQRSATGALGGTRASAAFWMRGQAGSGLAPSFNLRLAAVAGTRESRQSIDLTLSTISLLHGALTPTETAGTGFRPEDGQIARVVATLEVDGRSVRATITPSIVAPRAEARPPVVLESTLTEEWSEGPALVLGASSSRGGGVWLESAAISRPRLERCGVMLPPLGVAVHDGLERMDTALHAVTRGPDRALCAVVALRTRAGRHEIVALRSDDDGATWMRGDGLALGSGFDAIGGRWHALAWDPVALRYFAASVVDTELRVQSSGDCATWGPQTTAVHDISDEGARAVFASSSPHYSIGTLGHEVRVLVGLDDGSIGVVPVRSAWGDAGTWTVGEMELDRPPLPDWRASTDGTYAARLESHGAQVAVAAGGRSISVRGPAGWRELPALAAQPSSEAGAFDAIAVLGPATLVEDPAEPATTVWSGRLFYSGNADVAPDVGWGWLRVRIEPGTEP